MYPDGTYYTLYRHANIDLSDYLIQYPNSVGVYDKINKF